MGLGTGALAITAGTGLVNGIMGSNAASTAASQQEQAEQNVLNLEGTQVPAANADVASGTTAANSTLSNQLTTDQNALQPYTSTGTGALAQLAAITGKGGFSAPTAAQAAATPGYQFQLAQGEKAQAQAAAASGQALGGGELKAANDYAQNVASTNYGNTYNQSLSTYNENLGALQQLANMGLSATNTGVSAGNTLAGAQANNTMQSGELQSQNLITGLGISAGALTGQGNAAAAGTVGAANAWSGGLSGVANAATGFANNQSQMAMLNNILGKSSSGGFAPAPTGTATADSNFS
jgi:hypothetical protein